MSTQIEEQLLNDYRNLVKHGLDSIDWVEFQKALKLILETTLSGGTIWTAGNGASASIADHWACDYTKGSFNKEKQIGPRVISLCNNVSLITAISNDISYDLVFAEQLEKLGKSGDLVITITSSGQSPSILYLLESARKMGLKTIVLTGFTGGMAKRMVDVNLHVDCMEYEATEDCHSFIMQCLAKYLRKELELV